MRSLITLVAILAPGSAQLALAAPAIHPLQAIRDAAQAFVTQDLGGTDEATRVEVGKLDPRLRLAQCGSDLQVSYQSHSVKLTNTTVRVACPAPKPWSLYDWTRSLLLRTTTSGGVELVRAFSTFLLRTPVVTLTGRPLAWL